MLAFLGVPAHELEAYPRVYDRDYAPMSAAAEGRLAAYFAEPNRRLYELLGRDLGWRSLSSSCLAGPARS